MDSLVSLSSTAQHLAVLQSHHSVQGRSLSHNQLQQQQRISTSFSGLRVSKSSKSVDKQQCLKKGPSSGHLPVTVVASAADGTSSWTPTSPVKGQGKPVRSPPALGGAAAITSPSQESASLGSSKERLDTSAGPFLRVSPESLQYEAGYLGGISEKTAPVEASEAADAMSYLTRIINSKVYDVAIESPLELAPKLSERVANRILLKREDMQPVFSFKLRGAYNMMANLSREQLARGVICSSAGNHAQGVALAARRLKCDAVIAMPVTTPEIKWKSVKRLGATVVLVGDAYDETQAYAKQRALDDGRVFVPPFDHPDIIAGQGTVGLEIVRQHQGPLHAIFVPVGGGGLIAGIAAYMKRVRPEVRIIGVEPADANAMALSLHHGQRVVLDQVGGFADGVAVKMVGEETFRLSRELMDGVVLVSRDSICAAIKDMFEETRSILEPAGALSLAGAKAYCSYYGLENETVVAITSGANMNFDRLRIVTELADVGARKEAVLATYMPEQAGSFKTFVDSVGPANITEFKYRYNDENEALVLCSVGVTSEAQLDRIKTRMDAAGLRTLDMTNNDLAKDHLRHLMGGRTKVENEVLLRFVFPERPGTLMRFLETFSPRWNISLFHYRGQGEMGANVLVGMQVPKEDEAEFIALADTLGYAYQDERLNEAYELIMH
ncbi:threonine dehydratase [Marchantia polymorpha subsp. ruderalis]|uniref:Threonine dehydratase n=2 Tax=Marchantia polymorpha TaxID=3197 RepID=A0AAF6BAR2_MARPO|nr:hypothetical protein MARPO_0148s0008 [Marchantia polymorpha]BBN09096.1 hypothetical protein Mp_4g17110 [Marchantia polymorpha subsp. ruderalis]|eukprot:PTQ29057.1 hypothetical protein MARPO_0148s0008 [Marchantia polymorpha]